MNFSELKAEEEAKRERNWNPALRYEAFQRAIEWVDQQQSPPRASKEGCLLAQARLLSLYEEHDAGERD
jgi:hypothetical protein